MIGTGKIICQNCDHTFEILLCEHNLRDGELEVCCPECNEELILYMDWSTLQINRD